MTNPLATAADLLSRAAVLWPDAPGLPEGYFLQPTLKAFPRGGYTMRFGETGDWSALPIPSAAALALCCSTVRAIGTWWMQQDSLDRLWAIHPARQSGWLVWVTVFDKYPSVFETFDADIDAHLAALRAIVEQGEASRG